MWENWKPQKSFTATILGQKPIYRIIKTQEQGLKPVFWLLAMESRLELMAWPEMTEKHPGSKVEGFVHIAFSLGSKEAVDNLTVTLEDDGVLVLSGPRTTGDGYYESLIQDPEGILIEITV